MSVLAGDSFNRPSCGAVRYRVTGARSLPLPSVPLLPVHPIEIRSSFAGMTWVSGADRKPLAHNSRADDGGEKKGCSDRLICGFSRERHIIDHLPLPAGRFCALWRALRTAGSELDAFFAITFLARYRHFFSLQQFIQSVKDETALLYQFAVIIQHLRQPANHSARFDGCRHRLKVTSPWTVRKARRLGNGACRRA
jgi:hypothetical protein